MIKTTIKVHTKQKTKPIYTNNNLTLILHNLTGFIPILNVDERAF